ncbi:FkbM family methyltransferase [Synechocystis sp. FACHB-383]|uniref:FkbM family methyltransferase n=1 Tax=Synechocystis sp. FACHB-383 TaxID=2692864 RepID=UPI001686878E|nr:FkbM family methyltransferase [Synechocystis sp. FACHB-383]MBD2652428.1 FkbM family methyltransferase [Synechocystis sp. FACHB-383]
MRVEPCCQALLAQLLPEVDPQRQGVCIDVGVGTFAFYCQIFAELGFTSLAIEPLPVKALKKLAEHPKLTLLSVCLSDQNGEQTLYVGKFAGIFNSNFSSLSPQWFGASRQARQVKTITLQTLINQQQIEQITCLKLDIEGWEWTVMQQLEDLAEKLLPAVVMFEYGGGVNRGQNQKGWAPEFFQNTLNIMKLLKNLGYSQGILLDFAPDCKEIVFDLHQLEVTELEKLFPPESVYGNVIVFKDYQAKENQLSQICQPFYRVNLLERLVNILVSR